MKNSNTLFLTGLRGYSALAVFLIHSGGGGVRSLGEWGNKLVDFGKLGVISFFVLSAFTLSMSLDRTTKFSYSHYLSRRFARIFPMYFVAILIFWCLGGIDYYQKMFGIKPYDIFDLLAHLSFLNLWDERYKSTIIGVEWTVPIEMWVYFLIPPLFFFLRRADPKWGWAIFLVAIVISVENQHWLHSALAAHWAIEAYLYCFVAGIAAYSYWNEIYFSERIADILVAILLLLIAALCINGDYISYHWQTFLISLSPRLIYAGGANPVEQLLTLLVIALMLALSQARYTRMPFENRVIVFIGNVSFPFYLLHFPIVQLLRNQHYLDWQIFIFGLVATSGIAYLCHILIEKPALKLTGKLHPYDP